MKANTLHVGSSIVYAGTPDWAYRRIRQPWTYRVVRSPSNPWCNKPDINTSDQKSHFHEELKSEAIGGQAAGKLAMSPGNTASDGTAIGSSDFKRSEGAVDEIMQ